MIGADRAVRPSMPRWLAYRFFGVRVPYPCRFWVRDDVLGRWYLTRQSTCNITLITLFQAVLYLGIPLVDLLKGGKYISWFPGFPRLLLVYAGMLAMIALLNLAFPRFGRWMRREMLHKHDFHEDGTPIHYPPAGNPPYPPPGPGRTY